MNPHYIAEMDSPIGKLTLIHSDKGLCSIRFGSIETNAQSIQIWLQKNGRTPHVEQREEKLEKPIQQLNEYFSKQRKTFDLQLDLCGTTFQKNVWKALRTIDFGETCSYKEIAKRVGSPKAARAIGGANNKNPIPVIIPCHRVIGADGKMVGYGGGLDKKEWLLQLEDIISM